MRPLASVSEAEADVKHTNLPPQRRAVARRIAGHAQEDHILDPYQQQQKLNDGTACPQCGAVYHNGRWAWAVIDEEDEAIVIKTTDIHLPRRIGAAVTRAFHGKLKEDFDDAGYFVRVT